MVKRLYTRTLFCHSLFCVPHTTKLNTVAPSRTDGQRVAQARSPVRAGTYIRSEGPVLRNKEYFAPGTSSLNDFSPAVSVGKRTLPPPRTVSITVDINRSSRHLRLLASVKTLWASVMSTLGRVSALNVVARRCLVSWRCDVNGAWIGREKEGKGWGNWRGRREHSATRTDCEIPKNSLSSLRIVLLLTEGPVPNT